MKNISKIIFGKFEFFGVFRKSPPYSFYALQFGAFLYYIYWFLSKNFTVYGYFLCQFGINRTFVFDNITPPLFYYSSFQWIYEFFNLLSPGWMELLQLGIILSASLGLLGFWPKLNAWVSFCIAYHLVCIELICNGNLDGSTTLPLTMMFCLAISPSEAFYSFRSPAKLFPEPNIIFHYPLFIFYFLVVAYYFTSGLNKIIDIGPHWPFKLKLDQLALCKEEALLYKTSIFSTHSFLKFFSNPYISWVFGFAALVAELFSFTILFFPKVRLWFIALLIGMHFSIFFLDGLNYTGNAFILLLCIDFNRILKTKSLM